MTNPYAAGVTDTSIENIVGGPVSSSPWSVPQVWDTITIGGVTYGPLATAMTSQESVVAIGPRQIARLSSNSVGASPVGGKVRVRRAGRVYKFDKKNPQGQEGWTTTYRGFKPRVFAIEFYIWTAAQYDYYVESVFPVLLNNGINDSVQALSVQYPTLTQLGILSVFVESIDAIEEITDDRDKMYRQVVNVSEYIQPPPKNVTATPIGSKTTEPLPDGVKPTDFHQVAIDNQNKLIDELNSIPQ